MTGDRNASLWLAKTALLAMAMAAGLATPTVSAAGVRGGGRDFREITISEPKTLDRQASIWRGRSRLVGRVLNASTAYKVLVVKAAAAGGNAGQAFIERLTPESEAVAACVSVSPEVSVYESVWLPPGNYIAVVQADGCMDNFRHFSLKSGADTELDITFGARVFTNPH